MASNVVNAIDMPWESEEIPNTDLLFMRVHRTYLDADGTPLPGAFRDHNGGMSTDWNKYSTALETLNRARDPSVNAVISMNVGDVREIPRQVVQHSPLQENRAHTDVIGEKKTDAEVRVLFTRISHRSIAWSMQ